MFGPCCCGIPLQKGVKILAILEIIGNSLFFGLGWIGLFLAMFYYSPSPDDSGQEQLMGEGEVILLGIKATLLIVQSIAEVCVSIWLFLGANQRNAGKCRTWLIVQYVIISIEMTFFFSSVIIRETEPSWPIVIITVLFYSVTGYMIWVVRAFVGEIERSSTPADSAVAGTATELV